MADGETCDDGNTTSGDGCSSTCTIEPSGDEDCANGSDDDGDGAVDCADDDCSGDAACAPVEDCANGSDDDGDGAADCADADCAAEEACAGLCAAPIPIGDPSVIQDDTTGAPDIAAGGCQVPFGGGDGADIAYVFTPQFDVLEITLSSATDQGVFVRTTCDDPFSELGCADAFFGGTDEVLVLGVIPDQPLVVIASAFTAGEEGPFTLDIATRASTCGDGTTEGLEICDDGNNDPGDGCAADCTFELVCGDGVVVPPRFGGTEECDDGNTTPGDGCDQACVVEAIDEVEPNEDGSPELGGSVFDGNDFSSVNAQGPFDADVIIDASIAIPADGGPGDEDVFQIINNEAFQRVVSIDIFGGFTGFGQPCGEFTDTVMQLRDAAGAALIPIQDAPTLDDRDGAADRCSAIQVILPPAFPVFLHIIDFNDDDAIDKYWLALDYTECGDAVVEGIEECDDGNNTPGDGCAADCTLELVCGDGIVVGSDLGGNEECDDGNNTPGDGCDAACQVEHIDETEPNEDGTPEIGGAGTDGNDFDAANANGPFTGPVIIQAAFNPAGDEDVFEVQNTGATPQAVRLETFKQGLGIGVSCAGGIDTVLTVRDAAGALLDQGDDKAPGDLCSLLDFEIPPMSSVFVHVTEFDDDEASDPYFLTVSFFVCGDGVLDPNEQCDDGNTTPGDGCDDVCQVEPTEVEPNDDAATANPFADPYIAAINPSGDADFVAVAVTAGQTVTAATVDLVAGDCDNFLLDSAIQILDIDGTTILASDDDGGPGFCSLGQAVAPQSGTIFVRVGASPFDPMVTFGYRLVVTVN